MPPSMTCAGLFSGIGGVERGLEAAGIRTDLLCEYWAPAQTVLRAHWPDAAIVGDVRELDDLPPVDIVTAGWPCTDISQAGLTAGLAGQQSGLITEVFRLVTDARPEWVVLENVRNLLALGGGAGIRYVVERFESLGYSWAYRLVDSRAFGVPQRRQRVVVVASLTGEPADVLLADEAGEPTIDRWRDDAFGFYWTEGLRGLGWAQDAVPTLKGGSTVGIPSPPGVWLPAAAPGHQLVTPSVEDAEALQGFPRGWTESASTGRTNGPRYKLVGNAVTVGLSQWLGHNLVSPGRYDASGDVELESAARWPTAAWGGAGQRMRSSASMWPVQEPYEHLNDLLAGPHKPLSVRAAAGFLSRAQRSSLRFDPDFLVAVKEHIEYHRV